MVGFGWKKQPDRTIRKFRNTKRTLHITIGLLYLSLPSCAGIVENRWYGCPPINGGGAPDASSIGEMS